MGGLVFFTRSEEGRRLCSHRDGSRSCGRPPENRELTMGLFIIPKRTRIWWTAAQVNERLSSRKIQCVIYAGATQRLSRFRCQVCQHEWKSTTANIFKGNGCPRCGKHLRYTVE